LTDVSLYGGEQGWGYDKATDWGRELGQPGGRQTNDRPTDRQNSPCGDCYLDRHWSNNRSLGDSRATELSADCRGSAAAGVEGKDGGEVGRGCIQGCIQGRGTAVGLRIDGRSR